MTEDILVREALDADVDGIASIYNDVLATTSAIWSDQPVSVSDRRRWLADKRAASEPVVVAWDASGVLGFAAWGPFRTLPGYVGTIEHSIHVRPDARGRGVGTVVLAALEDRARSVGVHVMVAALDAGNDGSLRFHQRAGFIEVGRLSQVGQLRGTWRDLVLVQKILAG
ncbi:MAG TPA: GNAT family N-acetyltransferase [Acidimicrobiales bacterium]